jgi:cell wall assembly regulator SMI1
MKSGPREYARRLAELVRNCGDKGHQPNHIVFLDKNHPCNAITKAQEEVTSNLPGNVRAKFMYMIPEVDTSKAGVQGIPFTPSFLL